MDDSYKPHYDESKDLEMIFDFHNTQILRMNTLNSNTILAADIEFDIECTKRFDSQGRIRALYVVDTIPPLSAILKFIDNPDFHIKWGVFAIIVPEDLPTLSKITPILLWGFKLSRLKGRFVLKIFDHSHRNNLKPIMEWMDQNMEVRNPQVDIEDLLKILKEKDKATLTAGKSKM